MKKHIKYFGIYGVIVGTALSSLYGDPAIPAECSTPGSCEELKPVLKSATLSKDIVLKDTNSSNHITIKAASMTTEDVKIVLPKTQYKAGSMLVMDANGSLQWEAGPDNDRMLGMVTFMHPDPAKHIYEINGQTVTDAKLAEFLRDNPIIGFYTSGDSVQMPDWRGRYLGGYGDHDIPAASGLEIEDSVKKHKHTKFTVAPNSVNTAADYTTGITNGGWNIHRVRQDRTATSGSDYSRPETVAMPIVIIGGN